MTDLAIDPALRVAFADGTYRTRLPEQTLEYIRPKLPQCGITRIVDVTRLDRLGIPTCCAIRPTASVQQVSNGKGTTKTAAQVSALMESIELFHAESGAAYSLPYRASEEFQAGEEIVDHRRLPTCRNDIHYSDKLKMRWFEGRNVINEQAAWVPASAVFFDEEPALHKTTTNGLASGNHLVEASLHALYEVIERDAGSRLSVDGKISLSKRGGVIDVLSVDDDALRELIDSIIPHSKVVMCYVKSIIDVYTFWVILLNDSAQSALTTLNIGWGTHRNSGIAASRALTEAAQSRLSLIHGGREDILGKAGYNSSNVSDSPAYRYFSSLRPTMKWGDLPRYQAPGVPDLASEWRFLLTALEEAGYPDIYRFDLTRPALEIPVVKMIVPGLQFNQRMF